MAKKAKKLEELLQPVKNYKAYNNVFRSREAPIIPWLAPKVCFLIIFLFIYLFILFILIVSHFAILQLRELRFMYDGNNIKNQDGTVDYDFLLVFSSFYFPPSFSLILTFLSLSR